MTTTLPADSFEALGLSPELLRAVQAAGYTRPTPVQQAVIAAVLAGRDVLARADTGSGKTAAFGLPMLQHLCERPRAQPRAGRGNPVSALVLAPTRELVSQTAEVLAGFARKLGSRLDLVAAHGGVSINPQMMALRGGADVVIATPGRLLDLQRHNALTLAALRVLVLDEADRLLGSEFSEELQAILQQLPARRQNLLLSATFPPELRALAQALLREPLEVDVPHASAAPNAEPARSRATTGASSADAEPGTDPEAAVGGERETGPPPSIEQHAYVVALERKPALLVHWLREHALDRVLVFVSMKRSGDLLLTRLGRANIQAAVFHADKSQHERTRRLDDFRSGKLRVLIATDLAGRGIDISDLGAVINYELPRSPNDYIHRIGRTGRAGRTGLAISLLCDTDEQHFRVIEKRIKQRLPREHVEGFEPTA